MCDMYMVPRTNGTKWHRGLFCLLKKRARAHSSNHGARILLHTATAGARTRLIYFLARADADPVPECRVPRAETSPRGSRTRSSTSDNDGTACRTRHHLRVDVGQLLPTLCLYAAGAWRVR